MTENNPKNNWGESIIDLPENYTIIALETTAEDSINGELIAVAGMKIRGDKVAGIFNKLIKPSKKISDELAALTNITNEDLENAGSLKEVLPEFVEFIGDDILVGHYIGYDESIINDKLKDLKLPRTKNSMLDTLRLAKVCLPTLESHTLIDIEKFLKLERGNSNRAMVDVCMIRKIYPHLKTIAEATFGSIEELREAVALQEKNEQPQYDCYGQCTNSYSKKLTLQRRNRLAK